MAKRNSTKTASKEAIAAAEPRIITYAGWQGVNWGNPALDAELNVPTQELAFGKKPTSDTKANQLFLQNNLVTCDNGSVCTRNENIKIADEPAGYKLTGVAICYDDYIYAAANSGSGSDHLFRFKLGSSSLSD